MSLGKEFLRDRHRLRLVRFVYRRVKYDLTGDDSGNTVQLTA
jgi:hypothetical protein